MDGPIRIDAPPLAPTLAALDRPTRPLLDRLAAAGFRHVQLSAFQAGTRPRDLDGSGRRDLVATLRRRGLAVAGVDAFVPVAHLADATRVDRAVDAVRSAIDLAVDLGRPPVALALPAAVAGDDGAAAAFDAADAIAALIAHAQRCGVHLADHAVPLLERAGVDIGIDPVRWLVAGDDPAAAVSRLGERVLTARLADLLDTGARGPLGEDGRLDVLAYRVALATSGYAAPVVLDGRDWTDAWAGMMASAHAWSA